MKKHLFPLFLLLIGANASAQQDFFALVGKDTPNIVFNDFRAIDGLNGVSGETIFTSDSSAKVFRKTEIVLSLKIKIHSATLKPLILLR